jgi:DNA-binding CsgD family transcriptional regulator
MRRRPTPTLPPAQAPPPRSDDRGGALATAARVAAPGAGWLAALARAHEVLLAPQAFADDVAWRARLAEALCALFGADHALVLLPGARRPYVGAGFAPAALDAMAAFHPGAARDPGARDAGLDGAPRVGYRDPALARLHARCLAVGDPVFTRRRNEAAMGCSVEGTALFDAVCRPAGVADFHGVFARTPHGDAMLFVAHGRRAGRGTCMGEAAVPLLRVLAPAAATVPGLLGRAWPLPALRPAGAAGAAGASSRVSDHPLGAPPALPGTPALDAATLRVRFGLTPREADVARGLARGWTRRQIAAAYGVSGATARHHTEAVFRKLGVTRRAAVALALLEADARPNPPA